MQKSGGVELNICFTHGKTTDVCTSLSLVFLALLPLWCGIMHIYIGLLPSGSIDAIACWEVCVSSTAGADGDRLFSLVPSSGSLAADRFQTIVKYFAHAA